MKIAVFAHTETGLKVVETFKAKGVRLEYLILSEKESPEIRRDIQARAEAKHILLYGDLLKSLAAGKPLISKEGFDLGILAWWPHIIKDEVLQLGRVGYLNFHPSLLPYNRGKNPNFWTLVEESPFGVSLHWVDRSTDGGDIAFQKDITKTWLDTGESLYRKSKEAIIELFQENFLNILKGEIPRIPQSSNRQAHLAKELDPASQIELNQSYRARDLLNLIRARTFEGHPACWFVENGTKYEVRIQINESPKKIE